MPILPIRLKAVAHIPHGSGDAEYHLIDADADNSDVIAIIDPNMILDDPAALAERLALASNAHDVLVAALEQAEAALKDAAEEGEFWRSNVSADLKVIRAAIAMTRGKKPRRKGGRAKP